MTEFDPTGTPGNAADGPANKPAGSGNKPPVPPTGGNEPTLPLPKIQVDDKSGSHLGRQIAVGAAVAAVALLAVVSAVLGTGGRGASAEEALTNACQTHVVPLAEAIEEWDGVGTWADDGGGEPDLATMTLAALEDLATIDATADLAETALSLQRGLDDAGDDMSARGSAVLGALDATADSLAAVPAPGACQTSRLQAAVAMG
ncbi:MAG: hypothetical protein AAF962_16775 [Actinomycetota bacterium]